MRGFLSKFRGLFDRRPLARIPAWKAAEKAEQQAIKVCDMRAVHHARKAKRDALHAALGGHG